MLSLSFDALVSTFRNEKRTFTDRASNTSREYIFCQLAGISTDLTTPYLLRVPENLVKTSDFGWLKPGVFARVTLGQTDLTKGILEGSVLSIEPLPGGKIRSAFTGQQP